MFGDIDVDADRDLCGGRGVAVVVGEDSAEVRRTVRFP
jgi:hypothetical protein